MPHDEELADRIRALLLFEPEISEKRMFGGVAFLLNGHIAVGTSAWGGLILRVEEDEQDSLMSEPGVTPFEMRGRAMRGWARVATEAVSEEAELRRWVATGVDRARALPPKE